MLTIRQKVENRLRQCGLWPEQAIAVMDLYIKEKDVERATSSDPMPRLNLNEPASGYPDAIINIVFMDVKPTAYRWLCERYPQHLCLPLFDGTAGGNRP